jgi:uncharacterized protein YjdB
MRTSRVHQPVLGAAWLRAITVACGLALVAGCDDSTSPQQKVKSVAVSPTTAQIDVGATVQLNAALVVVGSTKRDVAWETSAPSVATVSATGLVVGIAPGEANIVARSMADPTKTGGATIRVAAGAVATVRIDPDAAEIVRTTTKQFTVNVLNGSGGAIVGRPVTWMTGDPTIASVSATGVVTAIEFGQTSISATVDGIQASAAIVVGAGPIQRVEITPGPISLTTLETATLKAHPFDEVGNEVTFADIDWTSSDPSVATVTGGGLITPVGPGTATITATSDGVAGTVAVTVTSAVPTTIRIAPRLSALEQGETVQLSAVVKDAAQHVMNVPVSWRSLDPTVVAIAAAKVTGLKTSDAGVPVIASVDVAPGVTIADTLPLSVTLATPMHVVVTIDRSPIEVGEDTRAHATVTDARGDVLVGRAITWVSSNTTIARVEANGSITSVGPGKATITATCGPQSGSADITVTFSTDPVAKLVLTLWPNPVVPGMDAQGSAVHYDGGGHATGARPTTWRSSNTHVATVDAQGKIDVRMPGWTTITATSEGVSDSEVLKVLNPIVFIAWPLPYGPVFQNDRHTGAGYDPVNGYGYRVDMDWLMVLGATGYEVTTQVDGAAPTTVTVTKSGYAFVQPNAWVPFGTHFTLQVRALGLPGGPGPWSTRTLFFGKCILLDGTACGTPHLRVSVSSSGTDIPAKYAVNVTPAGGPMAGREVPSNGYIDMAVTYGDDQLVRLVDVPTNCSVVESPTRTVSFSEAAPFRSVSFQVVCRPKGGEPGPSN